MWNEQRDQGWNNQRETPWNNQPDPSWNNQFEAPWNNQHEQPPWGGGQREPPFRMQRPPHFRGPFPPHQQHPQFNQPPHPHNFNRFPPRFMQDDFPPRHPFERPPYPHRFDYPQGDFPQGKVCAGPGFLTLQYWLLLQTVVLWGDSIFLVECSGFPEKYWVFGFGKLQWTDSVGNMCRIGCFLASCLSSTTRITRNCNPSSSQWLFGYSFCDYFILKIAQRWEAGFTSKFNSLYVRP